MGLIFKYNVVGNCVVYISGEDDLLGLTFIFAKMAEIVTFFSLAYWLLLLFIMFCPALSSSTLINNIDGL